MTLSSNIWQTRKARIQTEVRLLSYDFHSQLMLIWYSLATVFASIYQVAFQQQSTTLSFTTVCLSVLTLCASLFVSNRKFNQRAMLIKDCYEILKSLYDKAAQAESSHDETELSYISREYGKILSLCENHLEIDFIWSQVKQYLTSPTGERPKLFIRFKAWSNYLGYRAALLSIYALPILIFLILRHDYSV